jgi:hypothetical protein
MKLYKSVLTDQAVQHRAVTSNTLHRSSLLFAVRPFGNSSAVVTLSNHFKIKRGIDSVGMRVWGFDQAGHRLFSDHLLLTEARVYRYDLAKHGEQYPTFATCQVEFYAAANLGYPFPAALVNHVGVGFHNVVHSYARVLNDVFEDEQVGEFHVAESSIDVRVDETFDTFVSFLTGPLGLDDEMLEVIVRRPRGEIETACVPVNKNRFSTTTIRLSEVFPGVTFPYGSLLKIKQPVQPMFFGRMIGGCINRSDGAFSANHTYYDHTAVGEYFDAPFGYGQYPLIPESHSRLVFYPIQAPSSLELSVEYFGEHGESLGHGLAQRLDSPDGHAAIFDVSAEGSAAARSYRVKARPLAGSGLPTRLSHQIVLGQGGLDGSINESLEYPQGQATDAPAGQPYLSWVQGVHGARKVTRFGLTAMRAEQHKPAEVRYVVYGERGLILEKTVTIPPNGAAFIDSQRLFGQPEGADQYFFIYTYCQTTRIKLIGVVHCLDSGHCSAEHNF